MGSTAGTTYLITGANRGLGLGLVTAYLSRPETTVIAGVRDTASKSAKSLQDLPKASGSRVILVKIDSKSSTDADAAIESLKRDHGITSLDVVIANAGIAYTYPFVHEAATQAESMLEHYTVNVIGVVTLFRAVRPLLLPETGGSSSEPKFITMSSAAGSVALQTQQPVPNAAYGPTKAAVNWITYKMHLENQDKGLCVISLHPGWVQTEMGNKGAVAFGLEKAPLTIDESINGVVKVIDGATKEKSSGKFLSYDGEELPW